MGLLDYGNDGFMYSDKSKKSRKKKNSVFADGFSLPVEPKRKSSSYTTPKKKRRKPRKTKLHVKKSETYFGIDGQGLEDSIKGMQTMYHDVRNFKQNVRNTKTKKIHDEVTAYKKQEKLNRQRIRDDAYLKKRELERKQKIRIREAEQLRKKQHAILDKYGYVEGRKILAKKASMKQSLFSRLRRRVVGY